MTEVRLIRPVEVSKTLNNPTLEQEVGVIQEGFNLPDINSYLDLVKPRGSLRSSRFETIKKLTILNAAELLEYKPHETSSPSFSSEPMYESLMKIFDSAQGISEKSQIEGVQRIHNRNRGVPLDPKSKAKKIFCGPTARIEDHPVESTGFESIIRSLCKANDYEGRERLRNLIEQGPENGQVTFDNPKDEYELVASIIRWLSVKDERKLRIRCSQEIRIKIGELLDSDSDYTRPDPMLGGVAGFCSLMLAVQGHEVTMHNEGHTIKGITKHFPKEINVINENPDITTLTELELQNSKPSPGHFTMSLVNFTLPDELGELNIRYKKSSAETRTVHIPQGHSFRKDRDVIISGATFPVGFSENISDERLQMIAHTHDAVLLSGFQYPLTNDQFKSYERGVALLTSGTAPVVIEYSEPKCKGSNEEMTGILLLRENPISMIAFNTSEAEGFLSRLWDWHDKPATDASRDFENRLQLDDNFWLDLNNILARSKAQEVEKEKFHPDAPWRNPQEDSIWLYDAARLIQQVTDIPVVRIRAMDADVTLFDLSLSKIDAESVVEAVTFSRHQAYIKSAIAAGNIRNYREEVLVTALPTAEIIASNMRLAMELNGRFPTELNLQRQTGTNWFTELPNGQLVVMAVPFTFRVQNHTVSAGDTMGATATSELTEVLSMIHKRITGITENSKFALRPENFYG
jgi:hypothetical protein